MAVGNPPEPALAVMAEPQVTLLDLVTKGVQPPAALFVTPDDALQLAIRNSLAGVSVQVVARVLRPRGDVTLVQYTFAPGTTRAVQITSQPLTYGYLISAVVYAIGATIPRRGQTYASLAVVKPPIGGFLAATPLGGDYLTASNFVSWPYGRVINPTEGPGVLLSITPATPAAGAEWSQTVPTGARWRIRGIRMNFVTSAAVATRQPQLLIADAGAGTVLFFNQGLGIVASSNVILNWVPGWPVVFVQQSSFTSSIPLDLVVFQGFSLQSFTSSLQVGDQYLPVRILVEEWLED